MDPPRRKTLHRYEHAAQPRFLTFSCFQRLPLFNNDLIKHLFADSLRTTRDRHGFLLRAWVVMPEHVHLLVIPRPKGTGGTVTDILRTLKKPFATKVLARWKELNASILQHLTEKDGTPHFWQAGGGFDRNLHDGDDIGETINYIHQNPVRRGLVQTPTDWPWSSARAYAGDPTNQVPIDR